MSDTASQEQLLNPLTNEPYGSLADMNRVVRGLVGLYLEDPGFHFSNNPDLRGPQLAALNRGFGFSAVTSVVLESRSVENGPEIRVIDVSDHPIGEHWDNVLRLVEQGQASLADDETSSRSQFARLFDTWRPGSDQEMNTAVKGVECQLKGSGSLSLVAVEGIITSVENFLTDSVSDETSLNIELLGNETYKEIARMIRINEPVLNTLIKMRVRARIFEGGKRVIKDKTPYNKHVNEVREELAGLADNSLVFMWSSAQESASHRTRHWQVELDKAKNDPRYGMAIKDRLLHATRK